MKTTHTERTRQTALWISFLAVLPAGCETAPLVLNPQNRSQGLVIVLPGIDGRAAHNEAACRALGRGVGGLTVELHDWTTPLGPLFNQCAVELNRRKAGELASRIVAYRRQYPGASVFLIGHSGGTAIAAWAAEALPEGEKVDGIIMLASSLSPEYDLSGALRHTRLGIISFYSARDSALLGVGTCLFGTMDRRNTDAAGKLGFRSQAARTAEAEGMLRQVAWDTQMAGTGHEGGHFGCTDPGFVGHYVAPILDHKTPGDKALSLAEGRGEQGADANATALAFRAPK